MYDFLLFTHVLAAFCLMTTIVTYTAFALGWPATTRDLFVSDRLWDVGGLGTLIFGVWLVLNRPEYDLTDGWIIGALLLWFGVTGAGEYAKGRTAGEARQSTAVTLHWVRVAGAIAILALMIFKPGA